MKINAFKGFLIISTLLLLLAGCGGGGGGGGEKSGGAGGFYAGTWDVNLIKVLDDCGSGVSRTFVTTVVVNQDGNRVVVDSGSVVFTGATTDTDGFLVSHEQITPNGCPLASAYSFKDASDGEAATGLAFVANCGGVVCTVGYGGIATRRTSKSAVDAPSSNIDFSAIGNSLVAAIASGEGEVAMKSTGETSAELADLVAPANE